MLFKQIDREKFIPRINLAPKSIFGKRTRFQRNLARILTPGKILARFSQGMHYEQVSSSILKDSLKNPRKIDYVQVLARFLKSSCRVLARKPLFHNQGFQVLINFIKP